MPFASATIDIEAPIETVWDVLLDLGSYPEWNPFVAAVDLHGPREVGTDITLHITWRTGKRITSRERITKIDAPDDGRAELEYEYRGIWHHVSLIRGRRSQRLEVLGPTSARYTTDERLRGALSYFAPMRNVRDGFSRNAHAIKARAEAMT